MDAYARGVARDLGHRNITVNILHLGLVETDMSVNYAAYKDAVLSTCIFQRHARDGRGRRNTRVH
jgi:NAD(P)-dependent dehydrogenase (short-subunit alcohol dehydrogenase family)